jgi:hypothetical protein
MRVGHMHSLQTLAERRLLTELMAFMNDEAAQEPTPGAATEGATTGPTETEADQAAS